MFQLKELAFQQWKALSVSTVGAAVIFAMGPIVQMVGDQMCASHSATVGGGTLAVGGEESNGAFGERNGGMLREIGGRSDSSHTV